MRYNRYQAMGIIGSAIRVGDIRATVNEAARSYFNENKTQNMCTVKRVMVRSDGTVHNDPDFRAKKVSRIEA